MPLATLFPIRRVSAAAATLGLLAVLLTPLTVSAQQASSQAAALRPSLNWSGYVATNAYYTGVTALIQAPTPNVFQQLGVVASWVGIGGAISTDLIQAGVEEVNSGPFVSYNAWYETLPQASRAIVMDIGPGDWVLVDVHELTFNLWQITIVDGTQVFQQRILYPSSHSSAEWIVEEPALASGRLLPLAGVTEANFGKMSAIANGKTALPRQLFPQGTAIVSPRGLIKAVPTGLGPDGASFSVTTTVASDFGLGLATRTLGLSLP